MARLCYGRGPFPATVQATLNLTQSGTNITGTYSDPSGPGSLTGSITGTTFNFTRFNLSPCVITGTARVNVNTMVMAGQLPTAATGQLRAVRRDVHHRRNSNQRRRHRWSGNVFVAAKSGDELVLGPSLTRSNPFAPHTARSRQCYGGSASPSGSLDATRPSTVQDRATSRLPCSIVPPRATGALPFRGR